MKTVPVLGLVLLLAAGASAEDAAAGLPEVVAEIDGQKVTRDEFLRKSVEWYGSEVLEEIILRRVVDRAVADTGASITDKELDARVELEIQAREREIKSKDGLTLAQFLAQFGRTVDQFRKELRENEGLKREILLHHMLAYAYLTEPCVAIQHILVRDERKAQDLRTQAKDGADFGKLAEKESDDRASAPKGGRIAPFIHGMSGMGTKFEDAAFALREPGDVSTVVQTELGYHVLRLVDRRTANPQKFEALRPQIAAAQMDRMSLERFMRQLRQKYAADVKYFVPELEPKKK